MLLGSDCNNNTLRDATWVKRGDTVGILTTGGMKTLPERVIWLNAERDAVTEWAFTLRTGAESDLIVFKQDLGDRTCVTHRYLPSA
jgi:hypothetical protein